LGSAKNHINELKMDKTTDRVLFVWLFFTGLLGSLVGVPYTIAVLMDPAAGGPIDPRSAWMSAIGEALLFLAPASAIGIWLGKRVGMGPKLWRSLVSKASISWRTLREHLLLGMLVGFFIGIVSSLQNELPKGALGAGLDNPTTLEYLFRCLSAAITEEIEFRLGLITLFVWIIRIVLKKPALRGLSLWIGSLLSALLFAGAHLPHMLTSGSAGSSFLIPVVVFNTVAGLILGWLFLRYSMISAMIAHFIADAVVVVMKIA
jgi:hypothetical protein